MFWYFVFFGGLILLVACVVGLLLDIKEEKVLNELDKGSMGSNNHRRKWNR